MMLDTQTIVYILAVAAFGIIGYFYKQHDQNMKDMADSIHAIKVDLPTNYVRKDELSVHLGRIEAMLNKIFDKLDNKVDK